MVSPAGARVQGYAANEDGAIATSAAVDLQIKTAPLPATATQSASIALNLDGRKAVKDASAFSITDASSYQNTTSLPVYDEAGNQYSMSMYFVKSAASEWSVFASADGKQSGTGPVGKLAFKSNGEIDTAATSLPFSVPLKIGRAHV